MRTPEEKILRFADLPSKASLWKSKGKKVVSTNGCFDLLHRGHIEYLAKARKLGDLLVVGVNSDESVKGLKGDGRPINDEKTRLIQLAGLESVDFVFLFEENTPERFIELLKPDIHAKGGDYSPDKLPEKMIVEKMGGQIRILPMVDGYSTTKLIEKLKMLPHEKGGARS